MEEKEFVRVHHHGDCKFFKDFMTLTFGDE